MKVLSFYRMRDVPEVVKEQLRELSFGRDAGGSWGWTFSGGDTWCATLSEVSGSVLSWACLTFEEDRFPVAGCYTAELYRKQGLGSVVVSHLLSTLNLEQGTPVYAVSENWPAWPELLKQFGLVHFEWE